MSLDQKEIQKTIEGDNNDNGDIAESLSQLMNHLSDEEQHNLFSELSEKEIKHISVIATAGGGDEITEEFLKNYKMLKVSKKRRGRKELVNISEAFSGVFETQQGGHMDKIKGALGL